MKKKLILVVALLAGVVGSVFAERLLLKGNGKEVWPVDVTVNSEKRELTIINLTGYFPNAEKAVPRLNFSMKKNGSWIEAGQNSAFTHIVSGVGVPAGEKGGYKMILIRQTFPNHLYPLSKGSYRVTFSITCTDSNNKKVTYTADLSNPYNFEVK